MAIGLADYEFQLGNSGVRLNGPDIAMPYVDINKVSGLDSAPYRETIRDHEGMDGGFIDAEFEKGREIVLEGTAFCAINNVEPYLDNIKANFAPTSAPIPFYFKSTGVAERVVFVKPRGVRFDWDTARRLGMTPIQFLMYAEDPRIYDNALNNIVIQYGGAATTGFGFSAVVPIITDTFTRTVSNGWNTPDVGGATTTVNGTAANYSTNGTVGNITNASLNVHRTVLYSNNYLVNSTFSIDVTIPAIALTQPATVRLYTRYVDSSNNYWLQLSYDTGSFIDVSLGKTVAGADTTFGATANFIGYTAGGITHAKIEATGTTIRGRVWQGGAEPATWVQSTIDGAFTVGFAGVSSRYDTGNTNALSQVVAFDNASVMSGYGFGFNLSFGASVPPNGAYISISGNRPTPATLTIAGPVDQPRIVNDTLGKTLILNTSLSISETLVLDLAARTVLLNGTVNRRNTLQNGDWFLFNAGSTFIRFGGASSTTILTTTKDFEDGTLTGWIVDPSCTFANSTAQARTGTHSGLMTVVGSPGQAFVRYQVPVVELQSYTLSLWVYSTPGYANVAGTIDWFDANNTYITTNSTTSSLAAATWANRSITVTAPANAAYARFGPTLGATPTGQALYSDDISFVGPAVNLAKLTVSYRNAWR